MKKGLRADGLCGLSAHLKGSHPPPPQGTLCSKIGRVSKVYHSNRDAECTGCTPRASSRNGTRPKFDELHNTINQFLPCALCGSAASAVRFQAVCSEHRFLFLFTIVFFLDPFIGRFLLSYFFFSFKVFLVSFRCYEGVDNGRLFYAKLSFSWTYECLVVFLRKGSIIARGKLYLLHSAF